MREKSTEKREGGLGRLERRKGKGKGHQVYDFSFYTFFRFN
jgi:hypothetical protein